MTGVRDIEINDAESIRWSRVISDTLWVFDGYREWTDSRGVFHPGWMTAERYIPWSGDWETVRRWSIH